MSKNALPKIFTPRVQLRLAREKAGWSQIELAQRLGTVQVTVSRWETGETAPSPYFRRKLSELLGKTPEELDLIVRGSSASKKSSVRSDDVISDPLIPPPLRLPLIGREHELVDLRVQLSNAHAVTLAVSGLPGVGKTTLACTLAHDPIIRAAFPDGILWAGLGVRPDLQQHLVRWGTLLGLAVTTLNALHDGNHEKDLVVAVRGAIGERRMLLILDDAWTVEDALACHIGGPECATLVTTRFPTIATTLNRETLILHELTSDQSLDLLYLLAPQVVEYQEQKILSLIQAVGGLPLALTLIGNYLRLQGISGQTRRVQSAMDHLLSINTRLHLSEPRTPMDRHPSLSDEQPLSLNSIIAVTDQQLHSQARDALYALSVLPAKPESFSEEAALTITTCPLSALYDLLDMGLMESAGDGRYTIHQTIADYARLHLDTHSPQERLITYALTFLELHRVDYEVLAQESSTLLLALEAAYVLRKQREVVQGVCAFLPFLLLRGNYTMAQFHLLRAQQAALALNDSKGLITTYLYLGDLAGRQGNYMQSQTLLQEGIIHARRQGDSEHLCALLSLLGRPLWKQGKYAQAEAYLQEGLLLARQNGYRDQISELLSTLGSVVASMGQYARSAMYLEEGLTLARQTGDRRQLCTLLMNFGVTASEQGRTEYAYSLFEEGLSIARQIGHREWACVFLSNLGDLARVTRQDYVKAEALLQEGLTLAHQIGQREWMCAMLINLTQLEVERGNYSHAQMYLEECEVEAAMLEVIRINIFVLFFRGILALPQGKFEEAKAEFDEMQRIVPQSDVELHSLLQYGLAQLAASQGQLQQARQLGEASALTLERIGHYQFQEVRRWLSSLPPLAQDQVRINEQNSSEK